MQKGLSVGIEQSSSFLRKCVSQPLRFFHGFCMSLD